MGRYYKVRKEANKSLEKARQGENRIIGNSLDAKVILFSKMLICKILSRK